ncbi:MAG: sensor histidine kinase [Sphingomicrobium sp.]
MEIDPASFVAANSSSPGSSSSGVELSGAPTSRTKHRPASEPTFIDVFQQLIDGLPEQIALLDESWNILAVNEAWTKTAALYGYAALQPGTNYVEFCKARVTEGHEAARPAVEGIRQIDSGACSSFRYLYDGNDRWEGHTFQLCINRLEIAGRTLATVTRYDVTEVVQLRRARESYGHSFMEGQAEERRRMAREIHDSTLQLLTGLGLVLGQLKRARAGSETLDIVAEMEALLLETHRDIRAISFLAHPPLLNDMGLPDALRGFVDGFGRRTGLSVSLNIDDEQGVNWRPADVLFRVVQEALSNVHRHAHASNVAIGLFGRRSMYHVVITDDGIGMPTHVWRGVGLTSMRERLSELGGRLTVRAARPGTTVIASVPANPRIRAVGDLAHRT